MASSMFLYWGSGSVPCWRAMIALEEKGFGGYPKKLLSFDKNEHKGEEVTKLNPRGQLPTFKHGDLVINESLAIVDYLESTFPNQGTSLIPADPAKRALVLQRKYEANILFSKGIEGYVYKLFEKPEETKKETMDDKLKGFRDELGNWEGILSSQGGGYAAGGDFTIADVMLFPSLAFIWRLGLNMDKYPRLNAYFEKTKPRPSIQASWPPHWNDSPNLTKLKDV